MAELVTGTDGLFEENEARNLLTEYLSYVDGVPQTPTAKEYIDVVTQKLHVRDALISIIFHNGQPDPNTRSDRPVINTLYDGWSFNARASRGSYQSAYLNRNRRRWPLTSDEDLFFYKGLGEDDIMASEKRRLKTYYYSPYHDVADSVNGVYGGPVDKDRPLSARPQLAGILRTSSLLIGQLLDITAKP